MKRYLELRDQFLILIETKSHGYYQRHAYDHSFSVSSLCLLLGQERHLNPELCAIIGLFHDLASAIYASNFQHGPRSAQLLEPYLVDFTQEEKDIILHAISHHSSKDIIDGPYDECLKDADVLYTYLHEHDDIYTKKHQQRLKHILHQN